MKVKLEIKEINSDVEQAMADYIQDTIDAFMNVIKVIDDDYKSLIDYEEEDME